MSSGRISHFPHQRVCLHHHSDALSHCSLLGSLITPHCSISTIVLSPLFNKPYLLLQVRASYLHYSLYHSVKHFFSPLSLANLLFPLGLLPALLIIHLPLTSFLLGYLHDVCAFHHACNSPSYNHILFFLPRAVATYAEISSSVCNHRCTS